MPTNPLHNFSRFSVHFAGIVRSGVQREKMESWEEMRRRLCRVELSGPVRCDDGDAPDSLRGTVTFFILF